MKYDEWKSKHKKVLEIYPKKQPLEIYIDKRCYMLVEETEEGWFFRKKEEE